MGKRALITGIKGQDGSYLAELLLGKGYEVHGIIRRLALEDPEHRLWRIGHILDKITLHSASIESYAAVLKIVEQVRPHECYHLAARSFVSYAFEDEFATINTNINATLFMLSAIKEAAPQCRFYFAGSSEMFGSAQEVPQNEHTPLNPRSPYGISKTAGFHLNRSYRDLYAIHTCAGILYNHESPRRSFEFVTRKISHSVAMIAAGLQREIHLGSLEATRDWGFAGDYVEAMWLMLQKDTPDDYVVATGVEHSVKDFAELAFRRVGLNWEDHVAVDKRFIRPGEPRTLRGDPRKARKELGWQPKVSFEELVAMMVEADLQLINRQPKLQGR